MSSVRLREKTKGGDTPTTHLPELILNNFKSRLGRRIGRMFAALFPQVPQFEGRQVVTFHNQRDYIFFRQHRYIFRSEKRAGLKELGPRFTLKLRSLQKGTFDSKYGEFEYEHRRKEMDTEGHGYSKKKFFLMCAGGFHCSRLSLLSLNVLYMIISIVLMSLAGYANHVGIITAPPVVGGILAVGIFLFLVSFLGIFATVKHHQVGLFFYVVILFILFIVEFSVSIACLALSHTQQLSVIEKAWNTVPDTMKQDAMKQLDCCGFDRSDYEAKWTDEPWKCVDHGIAVPDSDPTKDYAFCKDVINDRTDAAVDNAGFVALIFSFTEMFGVWLAIRFRNQRNPAGPSARAFE